MAITFEPVQWSDWDEILCVATSAAMVDCLLNTLCSKFKYQGLYLVTRILPGQRTA